jgi:2-hydroxychromene-2-carboxylate isomerase
MSRKSFKVIGSRWLLHRRNLQHDPVFSKCQISYLPISLGGLMKACGNAAPMTIKSAYNSNCNKTLSALLDLLQRRLEYWHGRGATDKDRWITVERRRWTAAFNIPMNPSTPANFPPRTLGIMRQLAVLDSLDSSPSSSSPSSTSTSALSSEGHPQQRLIAALDALFPAFWVDHLETHQPDTLRKVLISAFTDNNSSSGTAQDEAAAKLADKLAELSNTQQGKDLLIRNTDRAFADGAFGLPWMVCTNSRGETEGFWGVDHLAQVAAFLGLERPGEGGNWGWKSVL